MLSTDAAMIRVRITKESNGDISELGEIRITRTDTEQDEQEAGYVAEIAVERCGEVGFHTRTVVGFPRTKTNVLGLVLAVLLKLDQTELELARGTRSADLARRFSGALRAIQARASKLHRD
jgi:hypothetical protein